MRDQIIYVLHKNGANNHYIALESLLKKNNVIHKYREFSIFSNIVKSILKLDIPLFKKEVINFFFIINLFFSKNKKIVLGIAPFDYKLKYLLYPLKNHKIYFHTSWTCWDKSFHPKTKKNTTKTFSIWKHFIEHRVIHIFSVTKESKNQLLKNYAISESKISVVYHSLNKDFFTKNNTVKIQNSFLYYGRLVPQKGIQELLVYFSNNPKGKLTIIGDGKERKEVIKFTNKYNNITYKEHILNKKELTNEISGHQYLVLNAKKNKKWEELFGLVIIECMAQGVIPIATNHSGPREIISKNIGYLFKENEIALLLNKLIKQEVFDQNMSNNGIEKAKKYLPENIENNWEAVLKEH